MFPEKRTAPEEHQQLIMIKLSLENFIRHVHPVTRFTRRSTMSEHPLCTRPVTCIMWHWTTALSASYSLKSVGGIDTRIRWFQTGRYRMVGKYNFSHSPVYIHTCSLGQKVCICQRCRASLRGEGCL